MIAPDLINMASLHSTRRTWRAFSLIEVVVAVGIFAVSIVAVIGLLGPASKSVAEIRDTDDATRVVGSIQALVQGFAEEPDGWTSKVLPLLQTNNRIRSDDADLSFDPSRRAYILFADRTGGKLGVFSPRPNIWNPNGNLSDIEENAQKFFEVVLIRNEDLSPTTNDKTAGYLAFTIRLRWPAYTPDGQRFKDNTQKNVLLVAAAIHR
jgi:type II secretory pathway pseudopilin PulG